MIKTILIINNIVLGIAAVACVAAIIIIIRAEKKLWKHGDSIFKSDKEDK